MAKTNGAGIFKIHFRLESYQVKKARVNFPNRDACNREVAEMV